MNRLKDLRNQKKLTQQELADKIGMTKRTIIAWEKGERDIKSDKAQQLADYFGVSVGYLLGYEEKKYNMNAKEILEMMKTTVAKEIGVEKEEVFVVWYCKTLQNSKALLSASGEGIPYFECTFDGDRKTLYVDVYKKDKHIEITL